MLCCMILACRESSETKTAYMNENELIAGGLYVSQRADSSYSICKLLVLEQDAVHIRMYADSFTQKPMSNISSSELKPFVGHVPMAKAGFLKGKPELLKVESVQASELEGYHIYLEAMNDR